MAQVKKSGLGRGLGALLKGVELSSPLPEQQAGETLPKSSDTGTSTAAVTQNEAKPLAPDANAVATGNPPSAVEDHNPADVVAEIQVEKITRGTFQPRQHFDDESLQELADSISAQGLIQPVLLRRRGGGYELIAGERRWRAAQLIGLEKIPAIVREMGDSAVAAVSLIENIQREDLNPLEEARALHRLKTEFEMTHQDVADSVGRSRTAVTNLIRLLDLDDRVADMLASGKIEMGHARALLSLSGEQQHIIAMQVYAAGLSVRATEALVRKAGTATTRAKKDTAKVGQSSHIKALENDLSEKLGAGVSINNKPGNKGTITVNYNSLDELDGILAHIK